jgi:hypothetical protein
MKLQKAEIVWLVVTYLPILMYCDARKQILLVSNPSSHELQASGKIANMSPVSLHHGLPR